MDHWKAELIQSFEDITSREVSKGQAEKAKLCIKNGGTCKERYLLIDFEKVLSRNQVINFQKLVCEGSLTYNYVSIS